MVLYIDIGHSGGQEFTLNKVNTKLGRRIRSRQDAGPTIEAHPAPKNSTLNTLNWPFVIEFIWVRKKITRRLFQINPLDHAFVVGVTG